MKYKNIKLNLKNFLINYRDNQDYAICYEMFFEKKPEILLETFKEANNTIIDIGAHLGSFVFLVRAYNQQVPIFAYEAEKNNFNLLKKNITENNLNCKIFCLAVSDKTGNAFLNLSQKQQNHSLLTPFFSTNKQEKVKTISLKNIFTEHKIKTCDLLKLDCEGAEFAILQSAPLEILKKIKNIFLEYHENEQNKVNDLIACLEKNDFKLKKKNSFEYQNNLGVLFFRNIKK